VGSHNDCAPALARHLKHSPDLACLSEPGQEAAQKQEGAGVQQQQQFITILTLIFAHFQHRPASGLQERAPLMQH
jgi:hypothetical protein